jgi:hypothetical protein
MTQRLSDGHMEMLRQGFDDVAGPARGPGLSRSRSFESVFRSAQSLRAAIDFNFTDHP